MQITRHSALAFASAIAVISASCFHYGQSDLEQAASKGNTPEGATRQLEWPESPEVAALEHSFYDLILPSLNLYERTRGAEAESRSEQDSAYEGGCKESSAAQANLPHASGSTRTEQNELQIFVDLSLLHVPSGESGDRNEAPEDEIVEHLNQQIEAFRDICRWRISTGMQKSKQGLLDSGYQEIPNSVLLTPTAAVALAPKRTRVRLEVFRNGRVATLSYDLEKRPNSGWNRDITSSAAGRLAQITNLFVSLVIAVSSLLLYISIPSKRLSKPLPGKKNKKSRRHAPLRKYRRRAFLLWILFWTIMAAAWLLVTLGQDQLNSRAASIGVVAMDNLNAIVLIVIYFIITRGNRFQRKEIAWTFSSLALGLGTYIAALYLLFPSEPEIPKRLHEALSLCLGFFSPVVLGWAFNLRFGTSSVLVLGVAYGLFQPLIYAAEVSSIEKIDRYLALNGAKVPISMTIAFLKVAWATAVTVVLVGWERRHARNLVIPLAPRGADGSNQGYGVLAEMKSFPTLAIEAIRGSRRLVIFSAAIAATYISFLIILTVQYQASLSAVAASLGVAAAIVTLFQLLASTISVFSRRNQK